MCLFTQSAVSGGVADYSGDRRGNDDAGGPAGAAAGLSAQRAAADSQLCHHSGIGRPGAGAAARRDPGDLRHLALDFYH